MTPGERQCSEADRTAALRLYETIESVVADYPEPWRRASSVVGVVVRAAVGLLVSSAIVVVLFAFFGRGRAEIHALGLDRLARRLVVFVSDVVAFADAAGAGVDVVTGVDDRLARVAAGGRIFVAAGEREDEGKGEEDGSDLHAREVSRGDLGARCGIWSHAPSQPR